MSQEDSPREYHMPAEWERHEGTWLSWPKNLTTFPQHVLAKVEDLYVKMIESLSSGERVSVLVDNARTRDRVASMLSRTSNIHFPIVESVDVWVRDYGPIFVKGVDGIAATKWRFNAWGNKYDDLKEDDLVGMKIAKLARVNRIFQPGIVLEGGSIDVNGLGSLLTTKQCLLNKNRNPALSQREISVYLENYLGAKNVIWLESGISGDDTDGHIDDVARFVAPDTVLCAFEDDKDDENYEALRKNFELLCTAQDQGGKRLNVIKLSMPQRKIEYESNRLPASYANFYIGNSAVLVPFYDDPGDALAIETIREFFPTRKVVGIESFALVMGLGSIHCVTQQQPS